MKESSSQNTTTETPIHTTRVKPGLFRPKPDAIWDTPWSYCYDPPLSRCGLWWRFWLSHRVRQVELWLVSLAITVLSILVGLMIGSSI